MPTLVRPRGLESYFNEHPDVEIVIFAGKGGLGKTTSSSSLAWYMSQVKKKRTLLFSTDPQASLSDIFERNFYGLGEIEVAPNLFVVEIDADRRVADYQASVKQKIKDMYGLDEVPREIEEYIDSTSAEPAMYESATYDAMAELVAAHEYDIYIFDMPPFGHGVRMVAMADILSKWVEKITEARSKVAEYDAIAATLKGEKGHEDAVMQELIDIRNKIKAFTDLITDRRRTAFFMVLIPEKMAILDTERALAMFHALGMEMSGLVVNQVYPRELLDRPGTSEYLRNRVLMQQQHLADIARKFGDRVQSVVPMFTREPKGLEMIEQASRYLMNCEIALEA
ncbi:MULTISPECIES: ArsA family ATPase [Thermaerobacter]|uniref:Arsenite-activated ATPase ArsA n=1 Tax=Thermaerobacter subterraneus DSM 13965 TaxID=867903 RepID=K6PPN7_9FIRM|nr:MULTISPECIES: TRC40/GET3/ArsA family transport-energizing ATPase [Thermaerobacter]EKP94887.1 arsenite-activated ATPase ArsA [Thermaerobacter subterraneus DSM 13965]QIA28013.1 ArsA family ATPase [Thermaerobacter sp. PB12/4term]